MRALVAGLGVLVLVYVLVHAAPAAIDAEIQDPTNSTGDDFARGFVPLIAEFGGWVPWLIAIALIIMVLAGFG